MKAKRLAILLCVTMLGGMLSGCGGQKADEQQPAAPEPVEVGVPVAVQTVAPQDFARRITVGGLTEAKSTVNVIAKVSGMEEIMSVSAKVGDTVAAGQVLATLNTDSTSLQLDSARLQLDDARRNQERMQPLFEAGAVAQSDMDQLAMAVQAAENNVKGLELALSYSTVTAPISGTIVTANAEVGSYASASAPVFVIADVATLEVTTGVNEMNVGKLSEGQQVSLTVGAASDQTYTGTIKEISKVMNPQTKNYPIKIAIDNSEGSLMAGMYAEIKIVTDEVSGAAVIPVEAIIYRDGQPTVMVVQDSKAVERYITTGLNDGHQYVVTEGLEMGEQVIIKGNTDLVNGDKVEVMDGGQAAAQPAAEDGAQPDDASQAE